VIFDAPIRERANPSFSPNPAKAPWYFMGLQELLIHFHPFFAVVVFPLTIILGTVYLPYLRLTDSNHGIWFLSETGRQSGKYAAAAGTLFTIIFILISELLPDPETVLPALPSIVVNGIIPFVIVISTGFLFMKYLQHRFQVNRSEYIQGVLIILVTSYSILSITGILFRGEGMALIWPWQI
jgi:hypothetical protein